MSLSKSAAIVALGLAATTAFVGCGSAAGNAGGAWPYNQNRVDNHSANYSTTRTTRTVRTAHNPRIPSNRPGQGLTGRDYMGDFGAVPQLKPMNNPTTTNKGLVNQTHMQNGHTGTTGVNPMADHTNIGRTAVGHAPMAGQDFGTVADGRFHTDSPLMNNAADNSAHRNLQHNASTTQKTGTGTKSATTKTTTDTGLTKNDKNATAKSSVAPAAHKATSKNAVTKSAVAPAVHKASAKTTKSAPAVHKATGKTATTKTVNKNALTKTAATPAVHKATATKAAAPKTTVTKAAVTAKAVPQTTVNNAAIRRTVQRPRTMTGRATTPQTFGTMTRNNMGRANFGGMRNNAMSNRVQFGPTGYAGRQPVISERTLAVIEGRQNNRTTGTRGMNSGMGTRDNMGTRANMSTRDMNARNMSTRDMNARANMGMRDNMSTRDMSTRNMSTRDMNARANMGMRDNMSMSTRDNISTRANIGTRDNIGRRARLGTRNNIGRANIGTRDMVNDRMGAGMQNNGFTTETRANNGFMRGATYDYANFGARSDMRNFNRNSYPTMSTITAADDYSVTARSPRDDARYIDSVSRNRGMHRMHTDPIDRTIREGGRMMPSVAPATTENAPGVGRKNMLTPSNAAGGLKNSLNAPAATSAPATTVTPRTTTGTTPAATTPATGTMPATRQMPSRLAPGRATGLGGSYRSDSVNTLNAPAVNSTNTKSNLGVSPRSGVMPNKSSLMPTTGTTPATPTTNAPTRSFGPAVTNAPATTVAPTTTTPGATTMPGTI